MRTSNYDHLNQLLRQVLAYVLASLLPGIDLPPELLDLSFHAPIDVRRYECHVVVIGLAIGVEDSNLLAHFSEEIAIKRRFTFCECGSIKAVLLVFRQTHSIVSQTRNRTERATRRQRECD